MNKKSLILLTLTFIMLKSSCVFAFSDITGHWAEDVINNASRLNVIKGYNDNSFRPDNYMTRAELITIINRLIGIEKETDKYIPDVTRHEWFYNEVKKAVHVGIIEGDNEGRVMPNNNVTREQAVLIISRAFNIENDDVIASTGFLDVSEISSWAKSEFLTFIRKQYITGYSDNMVRPQNYISRAEILTILDRVIKNIPVSTNFVKLNGNTLIKDRNIILKNMELYGDLIIGEIAASSVKLDNVIINGNLILYAPIDIQTNLIKVNGKVIKIYENIVNSNEYYLDDIYGIKFSIPDGASAYDSMPDNKDDLDLIIVQAMQNDEYYFKNITDISKDEIKKLKYDSIYVKVEEGDILGNKYQLYSDNATSHLLFIKRDNIVYKIMFMNIISDNIIDSVLANMEFTVGTNVINHENKVYKNSKLCLKFSYKEGYVGIDDSYNTGNIYSGDSMFKLFIQVNMIADIDEYSISEVRKLLRTLIKSDGDIINEKVSKISNHDTILFEIKSENNKIMSLYVIIGNNLYNFIFKGEEVKMDAIGKDMFLNIVNSMEF